MANFLLHLRRNVLCARLCEPLRGTGYLHSSSKVPTGFARSGLDRRRPLWRRDILRLVPIGRRGYRSQWLEDALYPRHAGERVRLASLVFGLGILRREEGYKSASDETFDLEETYVPQFDGSSSLSGRIVWSVSLLQTLAVTLGG